jgi:flagellar hook assembly protein FlgD
VRDEAGATVANGTGTGTKVDWTWDATAARQQRYAWSITAAQMRPATGSIGSVPVPLSLQKLKLAPTIVSPNGDGRGDEAKVSYVLSAAATVTAKVTNSLDQPVATIFDGALSAGKRELTWAPDAIPDGWYGLTLTAVAGKKQVQTSTRFWVDRTLAATTASAPAFSPRLKTLGLTFTLVNPAHVEVRVLRSGGVVATLLESDLGPGTQRLSWNGSKLPDGRYIVEVDATDSLLTVTQRVAVKIDRRAPTLRLVSLQSAIVRVSEPGTLVVAVNGRWRKLTVRRAGLVRVPHTGRVRGLTAYALDLAGNKSRVVSARR